MRIAARARSLGILSTLFIPILAFFAVPARAQFNSGFTGVVTEQSDAAVPGAKVIVTNQDTHVSRFAVSTDSGDFRITSLPGGTYTIEVQASGFKDWVQKDVLLESNEVKTLHATLALPTQTTTVEVTGAVAAVET